MLPKRNKIVQLTQSFGFRFTHEKGVLIGAWDLIMSINFQFSIFKYVRPTQIHGGTPLKLLAANMLQTTNSTTRQCTRF